MKKFSEISQEKAAAELTDLCARLDELQDKLYASQSRGLLVVLQGMDTSGKDGTIRHVFSCTSPLGVHVASFKRPTAEELSHDYLWRVHSKLPAKGEVVIFNRSHYEDVLVVRVHDLVPKEIWKRRYDEINEFEKMLTGEGTRIVKFFLDISKDEQKKRLQDRLDSPKKNWKFDPNDLVERKLWKKYMEAYDDVLSKTDTEWAPWVKVPADRKWYRNWIVSKVLVETLEKMNLKYPKPTFDPKKIKIQ